MQLEVPRAADTTPGVSAAPAGWHSRAGPSHHPLAASAPQSKTQPALLQGEKATGQQLEHPSRGWDMK